MLDHILLTAHSLQCHTFSCQRMSHIQILKQQHTMLCSRTLVEEPNWAQRSACQAIKQDSTTWIDCSLSYMSTVEPIWACTAGCVCSKTVSQVLLPKVASTTETPCYTHLNAIRPLAIACQHTVLSCKAPCCVVLGGPCQLLQVSEHRYENTRAREC